MMKKEVENIDAVEEFFHLMRDPKSAPEESWWFELRHRCDLPWAKLLAEQPQFEKYVHWESVSRLELVKLGYMAREIFKNQFPQGRVGDLFAFLTPLEEVNLLSELPYLENVFDWDQLNEKWDVGNWMMLLSYQPEFEKYFDWKKIEKKPSPYWEQLLKRQPQFACHCDLEHLDAWQIRKIKKHQPRLFEEL